MTNDWQMSKHTPEVILKTLGSRVSIHKQSRCPDIEFRPSHPKHWVMTNPVIKQIAFAAPFKGRLKRKMKYLAAGMKSLPGTDEKDLLTVELPLDFSGNLNLSYTGDSHVDIGDLNGGSLTINGAVNSTLEAGELRNLSAIVINSWGNRNSTVHIRSLHARSVVINMFEHSRLYIDDLHTEELTIVCESGSLVTIKGTALDGSVMAKDKSRIKLTGDFGGVHAAQMKEGTVDILIRS